MEYKIFVGGLTVQTTEEDLEEYFSTLGSITQTAVIKNKLTGLSKCYAFVHTNDVRTYQRIISTRHTLNGRIIDCKDGFNRHENPSLFERLNSRKFFVGGLSPSTQDKHLEDYFKKFGEVFKAYVIIDPNTNRSKRFGFIIMQTEESVFRVMEQKVHIINGYSINCKKFDRSMPQSGSIGEATLGPPGLTSQDDECYDDCSPFVNGDSSGYSWEDSLNPAQALAAPIAISSHLVQLTPNSKPYIPDQGPPSPFKVFAQSEEPEGEFQDGGPDEDDPDYLMSEKLLLMSTAAPADSKSLHLKYCGPNSSLSAVYDINNYSQTPDQEQADQQSTTRFNFCAQKDIYDKCQDNFNKVGRLKTSEDGFPSHEQAMKEFGFFSARPYTQH